MPHSLRGVRCAQVVINLVSNAIEFSNRWRRAYRLPGHSAGQAVLQFRHRGHRYQHVGGTAGTSSSRPLQADTSITRRVPGTGLG